MSCHDGKVEVLAEGKGATLECETDKFSTYLIAYKDGQSGDGSGGTKNTNGNTNGSSTTGKSSSSVATTATPSTGDGTHVALPAVLALVAGALLIEARRRREQ